MEVSRELGFEQKVKCWFEEFISKDDSLKVVISRKAPRLVEYCFRQGYGNAISKADVYRNIVSDYALPFVLPSWKNYEAAGIKNVMLSDEAVYFGSTFQMIVGLILSGFKLNNISLDRNNIYTLPVLLTRDADRIENLLNFPDKSKIFEDFLLEKEDVSSYVNYILTQFQTLGKSADIEYPILYLKLKDRGRKSKSDAVKEAFFKLSEGLSFKLSGDKLDEPYLTEHLESGKEDTYKNWTLLLNKLSPKDRYVVSPDFRKIRVFFTNDEESDRLSLTSFAPHSIPENLLKRNTPLFKDTPLEPVWNSLYDAINKGTEVDENKLDEINKYLVYPSDNNIRTNIRWETQLAEYWDYQNRSLVICANYLLSFVFLLDILPALKQVFDFDDDDERGVIDIVDLTYLVGYDLAGMIRLSLLDLLQSERKLELPKVNINPVRKHEYIPEEYAGRFYRSCREDFIFAKSVSELVSANFSNQRRHVEMPSRERYVINKGRLNFGESYTTLLSKCSIYYNLFEEKAENGLVYQLHKAMDFRIDNGSIVPKYIAIDGVYQRLFRAGENEDKYKDQLDRIIRQILKQVQRNYGNNGISGRVMESVFALTMGLHTAPELVNLGGIKFITRFENRNYKTHFNNGEIDISVLDHALHSRLLTCKDGKEQQTEYVVENGSDYVKYLDEGVIIDGETSRLLNEYTDLASQLCLYLDKFSLRKLLNWVKPWEPEYYLTELEKYKDSKDGLIDLYYQFPYNSLEKEMNFAMKLAITKDKERLGHYFLHVKERQKEIRAKAEYRTIAEKFSSLV